MYIMSIDQGTTGTTVSILDQVGSLVGKFNQEYPQIYPKPGWVEHNPEDIWHSVITCIQKTLELCRLNGNQIAAIGITNQRETVLMWDRVSGKPVHNAIVWQCRRTADRCAQIKKRKADKKITQITGLVVDPYFSATKLEWLFKNVSGVTQRAKAGNLLAGTVDTFLLWRMTSGASHKTDVSNASRTMLMDLKTLNWSKDLLKTFSIPASVLPEICDSNHVFGKTRGLSVLPDGIPISGIAGDQQAALFGQTCYKVGEAKCTYGTGSFLLMNTGNKIVRSKAKMLTTLAWRLAGEKPVYALEGGAFICGAAVQWLRDGLGLIQSSSEVESLARKVESSEGVEFVPALTGLGAPYWDANARGVIVGLTRGTTKSHLARATLEAMALQNVDILTAMQKDLGKKILGLRVDGGAAVNNLLMQMQADYMGTSVTRPKMIETTAIGAAYLAGLGVGYWKSTDEIKKIWKIDHTFDAELSTKSRAVRLASWHAAVKKCRS